MIYLATYLANYLVSQNDLKGVFSTGSSHPEFMVCCSSRNSPLLKLDMEKCAGTLCSRYGNQSEAEVFK